MQLVSNNSISFLQYINIHIYIYALIVNCYINSIYAKQFILLANNIIMLAKIQLSNNGR